jgi:hypothetical protein
LTEITRRIESLGFSFDDARKAAVRFLGEGLAPANLSAALEASARLSRAIGQDFADGVKIVNDALRGGVGAVIALREANISLTAEQRDAVIAAASLSNEFDRQRAVLEAIGPLIRDADKRGLSPLTSAINGAKEAWRGFLDTLGETAVFQIIKGAIDGVVAGLSNMRAVGAAVARALTNAFLPLSNVLNFIAGALRSLGRVVDLGPAIINPAAPDGPASGAASRSPIGGLTPEQERAQRERVRREQEFERDSRDVPTALRVQRARELAIERFREQFPGALQRDFEAVADLAEIEVRKKIQEELSRGSGGAANTIRRDFQAIAQDLQNTIRVRDDAIRGIQEDVASGGTTAAEGIRRIQQEAERARPSIERLRAEAQRFLEQGRGRDQVRDSAIQRVISQADRELAGQAAGGRSGRTGTNAILTQSRQQIQQQLQERQQFIQTQAALEQQGLITRAESERQIVALYGETREALQANIDAYAEANRVAAENGQITQAAARGNAAQIELWRTQLERINPEWARLKQGIENTFTQAGVSFFDSIAKSLGDLIAGVSSLEDVWEDAGRAALQFFADVLKGIAQVILQEQVLQAVRLVTKAISAGVGHTGMTVGQSGGVRRSVNPAVFAGAPRMHSGGIVGGLRNDERAAILQTGEEVLARDDPRNILNRNKGGTETAGGDGVPIRNILAIGDDEIANALNSSAGERVMFNMLSRNAPTLRAIVRG